METCECSFCHNKVLFILSILSCLFREVVYNQTLTDLNTELEMIVFCHAVGFAIT